MTRNLLVSTCLASLALATSNQAQTIQVFDGVFAGVVEATGPPAGPCAYPNGPIVGGFPSVAAFPCPTVGIAPARHRLALCGLAGVASLPWIRSGRSPCAR